MYTLNKYNSLLVLALLVGANLFITASVLGQNRVIQFQARVLTEEIGPYSVTLRLFDAIEGGTELWSEVHSNVEIDENILQLSLGEIEPLSFDLFSSANPLYLEIKIGDNDILTPRQRMGSVPRAISSEVAAHAISAEVAEMAASSKTLSASDGDPSTAVFVDSNGKVAVGIQNPRTQLHVEDSGNDTTIRVRSGGNFVSALELLEDNSPSGIGLYYKGSPNRLDFEGIVQGTNTILMSVLRDGNVGIGRSDPAYRLDVNGQIRVQNIVYNSDVRFKESIRPIPEALIKTLALKGVLHNWKSNDTVEPASSFGFIAQEVKKVLPELVSTDEQGFLSVSYGKIAPLIVEAIKEQQAQLESQYKEIESLKEELEQLKQLLGRVDN